MMTSAIALSSDPARLTQFTALAHLIMVLGIMLGAVSSQIVIDRPFGETPLVWTAVILGGPAIFLTGRGLFEYSVFSRFSLSRVSGLVLLGVGAAVAPLISPIVVAVLATTILAIIAVSNLIADQMNPQEPAPPALS
jgi:low temperature requirement protein LtrA